MIDGLPFVKLSGAGNDFVVVAGEDLGEYDPGSLAARLCTRALSLGADGLIVVEPDALDAVRVRFYNPDGSRAEMCGNGSRCAARYAVDRELVAGGSFRLLTDSGDLPVIVRGAGEFAVVMPEPADVHFTRLWVDDDGARYPLHALRVGVPHAVVAMPDVDRRTDAELTALGRSLRHHPAFPDGTNVNFADLAAGTPIRLRTYERGVEALTRACGTGSTATAFVARALYDRPWPIELLVDGGRLRIEALDGALWLVGDARIIARGTVGPDALDW
ncbi:MAG TPA: diaminopimelate epimerase [Thermomicrobiaceae bacterium]|nr:diaminopimelate epimerase [Thermomicrobiaceae bacterium]